MEPRFQDFHGTLRNLGRHVLRWTRIDGRCRGRHAAHVPDPIQMKDLIFFSRRKEPEIL